MNRRQLISFLAATPLAALAGRLDAVSKERTVLLAPPLSRSLGITISPEQTPMHVIENCVIIGTFAEAPGPVLYMDEATAQAWDEIMQQYR